MNRSFRLCAALVLSVGLVSLGLSAGCTGPDDTANQASSAKGTGVGDADGHDHSGDADHDAHGHEHGPQGGEMFAFAEAGLKGEWVASYGDNMVTFYIYDQDGTTEKQVEAGNLTASRKSARIETWEIPAHNLKEGQASQFRIIDESFAIAMKTTGASLEIEIDGVKYSTELPRDPHAH